MWGCSGLPVITAEREDAILRADKAEFEARKLKAEIQSLTEQLQAFAAGASLPSQHESQLSQAHCDSPPSQAPDSPISASAQDTSSQLNARIFELTQRLEEAAVLRSSMEADLATAHARSVTQSAELESIRASLSTQVAVLTQQLEAVTDDKLKLSQRAEQLSAEAAEANKRAETSGAERDTFEQQAQQLESELHKSSQRAEELSTETEELRQQLDAMLARAGRNDEAEEEVQKLQREVEKLQEKVQSLEAEAQESFEKFSEKEEVSPTARSRTSSLDARSHL